MVYNLYICRTESTPFAEWENLSVSQRDSGNQGFGKDRQFAGIGL